VALFGVTPQALLADGRGVHRLVHPDDLARALADMARADRDGAALAMEFRVVLANGQEKWVQANSTEVERDAQGVVHNGIMVDITERKTAEALVWQQAHFDGLTGLPNRCMLRGRLGQAMATGSDSGRSSALLLIDLDHFKEVNDTLGHDRGDELLVEAARRLRQCVGDADTVARMGGDEFAVVLATVDDAQDAARQAQHMINKLGNAFQLGAERAYVSASVGIALYGAENASDGMEDLLKHADQALYVAKDGGRNRYSHFTRVLQEQAQLRMRLATDLRHALDQRQFHVVYQPIVCLATGEVHKAEALIRWEHPERGLISPAVFIPIAESTGLINEIGDWVFLTAARQAKTWRHSVHPKFQISVNRSPVQFRNGADKQLTWGQQLERLGVPGEAIAVEITEGLLLDSGPGVSEQLRTLRDAGLPISLDDFGTGYSAMAYLQKFALDYLKIDRSFVNGMGEDASSRALCQAIVVMAHALGMKVVAEGIETQAQYDWLRDAGCDYGQGFLMSRPLKPDAFEAFVGLAPATAAAAALPAPKRLRARAGPPGHHQLRPGGQAQRVSARAAAARARAPRQG
jgi:diguanylate cyclase (GGDEF)-like protein/PAS domain S-box-containing protein